jgi:hypothetical protein
VGRRAPVPWSVSSSLRAPRDRRRDARAGRCASTSTGSRARRPVPGHGAPQSGEPRVRRDRQPRAAASAGDVVILNSDTAVTEGGSTGSPPAAAAVPDVATVTPLTSHGSICTLPPSVIDAFALEARIRDRRVRGVRARALAAAPARGDHRRRVLHVRDAPGARPLRLLDEETFGKGYGEEVDFCLRASRLGLRHLVDDSTFVYPPRRRVVRRRAERRTGARLGDHRRALPVLPADNTRERAHDPSRSRSPRSSSRCTNAMTARPHVLHILHSRLDATGGHREVRRRAARRRSSTTSTSRCSIRWSRASCSARTGTDRPARRERGGVPPAGRREPGHAHERRGRAARRSLDGARSLRLRRGAHPQPDRALARAVRRARRLPGPVVCSVHDLFLACPNFSLLYMKSDPCGIPDDLSVCDALPRRHRRVADARLAADAERLASSTSRVPRRRSASGSTRSTTGCSRARARPTTSCASTTPSPSRMEIIEHGSVIRLGRRAARPTRAAARRAVARRVRRSRLGEEGSRRGERARRGVPRTRASRSTTSVR